MNAAFRPCAVIPTYDNPMTMGAWWPRSGGTSTTSWWSTTAASGAGRAGVDAIARDGHGTRGAPRAQRRQRRRRQDRLSGRARARLHPRAADRRRRAARHRGHPALPGAGGRAPARPPCSAIRFRRVDAARAAGRARADQLLDAHRDGRPRHHRSAVRLPRLPAGRRLRGRGRRGPHGLRHRDCRAPGLGGVPIVNVPTRVRYLPAEEGGVSHFRPFRDNVAISWMHTRLVLGSLFWRVLRARRRLREREGRRDVSASARPSREPAASPAAASPRQPLEPATLRARAQAGAARAASLDQRRRAGKLWSGSGPSCGSAACSGGPSRGCCCGRWCSTSWRWRPAHAARPATTCRRMGRPHGFWRTSTRTACASRTARSIACSGCWGDIDLFQVTTHRLASTWQP